MEEYVLDPLTIRSLVPANSLKSLIQGYLLTCRCENKSPKTVEIYKLVLDNFLWYCTKQRYSTEIQNLSTQHIREFLWYLASEKNRWGNGSLSASRQVSSATVHVYYRSLKTFFGWLKRERLIKDNPFDLIKPPKQERKIIQALTTSEIQRLFQACDGTTITQVRNRAILSVLLDTGLRIAELADLNYSDVDQKQGTVFIKHGKGGKQRIVRIGSKAQKALWRYLLLRVGSDKEKLFINRDGKALDVVGMKMCIRRLGSQTSIKV